MCRGHFRQLVIRQVRQQVIFVLCPFPSYLILLSRSQFGEVVFVLCPILSHLTCHIDLNFEKACTTHNLILSPLTCCRRRTVPVSRCRRLSGKSPSPSAAIPRRRRSQCPGPGPGTSPGTCARSDPPALVAASPKSFEARRERERERERERCNDSQ